MTSQCSDGETTLSPDIMLDSITICIFINSSRFQICKTIIPNFQKMLVFGGKEFFFAVVNIYNFGVSIIDPVHSCSVLSIQVSSHYTLSSGILQKLGE